MLNKYVHMENQENMKKSLCKTTTSLLILIYFQLIKSKFITRTSLEFYILLNLLQKQKTIQKSSKHFV